MTVQCFWWASLCIDIHLSPQTNCNSNIGITFELQVRNRLATFKNWPFSEEEGSDCTPARFNQSCALSAEWSGVYQGWQRQASMPVEEITNLIWRAATFAGLAPANYLEAFLLALAHSSGKSLMGGILRMTPGLSMCPMQRLILGSFVSYWHSCFSGEMCLCQPGKESKWTDSSWCECNWRITSSFCLAWLSSLISSGLGCTRASQEQNGAHKGTNLPDFFVLEKLCHDFIKYC